MLELARSEREAMELPLPSRVPASRRAEPTAGEAEADDADDGDETIADEHSGEEIEDGEEMEVRTVRVKTSPFATPEDLARYALRHAESRRPRELYPTRLLVRRSGLVRPRGTDRRVRRKVAGLVEELRPEIKRCLLEEQSRRPYVILEVPESLVVQQAARGSEPIAYRFVVHLRPGEAATVSSDQGELSSEGTECIAALVDEATRGRRYGRAQLPITAFVQPGYSVGGGDAMHSALALEAATLGWVCYGRGQHEEALAYFRDAYWLFHLVEYQMLIGMALEQLDRPKAAAKAYAMYLERRPYAAEAPDLRETIARLRAED